MDSNIESLARISAGFRNGSERLGVVRRQDIRQSDLKTAIPMFELSFRVALREAATRRPIPLTRPLRVIYGIEK